MARSEKAPVAARLAARGRVGRLLEEAKRSGGKGKKGGRCDGFRTKCFVEIGDQKPWKNPGRALRDANFAIGKPNKSDTPKPSSSLLHKNLSSSFHSSSNDLSFNGISLPNDSHHHQRGGDCGCRLVIVQPSSSMPNHGGGANNTEHWQQHQQYYGMWPLYGEHCKTYGFSVDVEQYLSFVDRHEDEGYSTTSTDRADGSSERRGRSDGPRTNLFLLSDDNGDKKTSCSKGNKNRNSERKRKIPVLRTSEQLIIRPCSSNSVNISNRNRINGSNNGNSGSESDKFKIKTSGGANHSSSKGIRLHPQLKEGDIIQTLNGVPNPTFAVLYEIMRKKEKLVLEVVNYSRSNDGDDIDLRNEMENADTGLHHGVIMTEEEVSHIHGTQSELMVPITNLKESEPTAISPMKQKLRWGPKIRKPPGNNSVGDSTTLTASSKNQMMRMPSDDAQISAATMEPEGVSKINKFNDSHGPEELVILPTAAARKQPIFQRGPPGKNHAGDATILGASSTSLMMKTPSDNAQINAAVMETEGPPKSDLYNNSHGTEVLAVPPTARARKQLMLKQEQPGENSVGDTPFLTASSKSQMTRTPLDDAQRQSSPVSRSSTVQYHHIDDDLKQEAVLFDMVEKQMESQLHLGRRLAEQTAAEDSQWFDNDTLPCHNVETAKSALCAAAVMSSNHCKPSLDVDSSIRASLKPTAVAATATTAPTPEDVFHSSKERTVNISSSLSTPIAVDLSGRNVNSLSSSSSSSSDSSSSSSSSSSDSSTSSSSDSSSSSSDSCKNDDPPNFKSIAVPNKRARASSLSLSTLNNITMNNKEAPQTPTSLSRLWPDPSDVIKALTRWMPPTATLRKNPQGKATVEFYGPIQFHNNGPDETESNNPLLRSTATVAAPGGVCAAGAGSSGGRSNIIKEFKDANDILNAMAHPLMLEGLCSLNSDYHAEKYGNGRWKRNSYHLIMTKLTAVSPIFQSKSYFRGNIKMYEAQFRAHGGTDMPPSNLSELYCMHFQGWKCCKFGIVAHDFPTTVTFRQYDEGRAFLKLWLVVHSNERRTKHTGWLSGKDFKMLLDPHKNGLELKQDAKFTLMSCGQTTNIVRQFEAIKCLPYLKPHLQRALFSAHIADSSKAASVTKPRSLPYDIWRSLISSHNSYQLSAIAQLLSGSCRNNVCLVQGPPGTGKSSTIVGLVTALLSGKAPLPKQRQFGCLIHPGKSMGATLGEPQARNRILVCAATNQAVDSLAWKIKQESVGPSRKVGDFNMGRFGSLPWESSRNFGEDPKPESLSEMEAFLYQINVDRRASDGQMQDYVDDEEFGHKRKKRRRIVGRAKLRGEVLGRCNVVITTLSGAGSKGFIDAVCRDPTRNDSEFDAVIIDEACQASEAETLIPFKYNPTTITLVGDPQQLPVLTLHGSSANSKLFERSLFERLQALNFPTILLRKQYRMHEDIAAFPSQQFYHGQLITPDSVKERVTPPWNCPCFPTICFWDTYGKSMATRSTRPGFTNIVEADFIFQTLLSTFSKTFLKRSDLNITIGIISFYRDQVNLLRGQLSQFTALNNSKLTVKVATVDGFQGSECDIIILSCVRSPSNSRRGGRTIGFLGDYRRTNVALTRAKSSLWIVGCADALKASGLWTSLLQHLDKQGVLRGGDEFWDLFASWKSSNK